MLTFIEGRSLAAAFRALAMLSLLSSLEPVRAGGSLQNYDFTGFKPSPIPGQIVGTTVPYRQDDRCMPIHFRMNTTRDPVAHGPDGTPVTLAAARAAIEQAMASWNRIPTSYVDIRMVGTATNPGPPVFDFVNEVSFNWPTGFQAFGLTRSVTLAVDSLMEHGEDLDGDGDSDVSSAILTCQDVDGDGDIEFPAGLYRAGTILDTDIRFNPAVAWHLDERPPSYASVDLVGVATHELGHSHGLAHSNIVQRSLDDGTEATMHCCTGASRRLHSDDIAWSSFLYPEGSSKRGPGALQSGDVPFDQRYSVIRGQVRNGQNVPIAGAFVMAEDLQGRAVASAIGGRVQISAGGGVPSQYLPPSLGGLADGDYALPVPKGIYRIAVEPNDGWPEQTYGSNESGFAGFLFGNQNFVREYYNGPLERQTERSIGNAIPVPALHDRKGIDFRLDNNVQLSTFNADDSRIDIGMGLQGILLAVRIPRADILAVDRGRGLLLQAALFGTFPFYDWEVARFDTAMITTGRVAADGRVTIDLEHPLVERSPFVGADRDLTPLYVEHSRALGLYAEKVLPKLGKDLFVVIAFSRDSADPGFPGFSRYGVLGDIATPDKPARGVSFYSENGGKGWHAETFGDYSFGLVVAPR